jgi:hypothetical protein
MARKSVAVDKVKLTSAINQAESKGPLGNLSQLWEAAAEIYNKSNPEVQITPSVVYLRVGEFKIPTKTVAGKRGRGPLTAEHKEAMQKARGKRKPRAEKFASDPSIVESFERQKSRAPERYLPLVLKSQAGSSKAAIALTCLDCCCWQAIEVKNCGSNDCGLWPIRPYQSKNKKDDDEDVVEELNVEELEVD